MSHKKQLYFLTFGTDTNELWEESLKDVNHKKFAQIVLCLFIIFIIICVFSIEQAKLFITQMKPSGGCNLLKALKRILSIRDIDSIVLIIGSV